jgi:hypothetical protein
MITLAVYIAGILLCYRWMFGGVFEYTLGSDQGSPDTGDAVLVGLLAFMLAAFWPLALPIYLFIRWFSPTPPSVRRRQLEDQKRRIAELERELRIGGRR